MLVRASPVAAVMVACLLSMAKAETALPAFPGAEGFGATTAGGRGGQVIKVTNLKSSGDGSLNAACQAKGKRIVVFEVSGVIHGDVVINEPHITIAGQTAPGAGITIDGLLRTSLRGWNEKTTESPRDHDIVIRFLRVRGRPGRGDTGDCLQLSACDRAVIDMWARSTNITIQWCTIEESSAKQGEPHHNFGLIAGGQSHNITIHHNLFAHHIIRSPCIGSGPADFRNNVVYHFEQGFVHHNNYVGKPGFNFIGNYYKRGNRPWVVQELKAGAKYYFRDNFVQGRGLVKDGAGLRGAVDQETRVPPVRTDSPQQAYEDVLAVAGCLPRDAVTKRTVMEVRTGTGSYGRHAPGDLMQELSPTKSPQDSDGDGMPDAWERARNLNPGDPADGAMVVPRGNRHSGYTYVESYLNELAEELISIQVNKKRR